MSAKIRERKAASGDIAFYIDTYHKEHRLFSQTTGVQANPKNRKLFNQIKADALELMRTVEKDLERERMRCGPVRLNLNSSLSRNIESQHKKMFRNVKNTFHKESLSACCVI